jgi:hypothetical protein
MEIGCSIEGVAPLLAQLNWSTTIRNGRADPIPVCGPTRIGYRWSKRESRGNAELSWIVFTLGMRRRC